MIFTIVRLCTLLVLKGISVFEFEERERERKWFYICIFSYRCMLRELSRNK